MRFAGENSSKELLNLISNDQCEFDSLIAMANIGRAFSSLHLLEDSAIALVTTSRVTLEKKLDSIALDKAELFLERRRRTKASTLGRLISAIEESGVKGRDIEYLRAVVEIRNDFIHRFTEQVPLPGDWQRYNYSLASFSDYTWYVIRHAHKANYFLSRIMVKHGLLEGEFGSFGAVLFNPDDII
jgi:hypothetical protein